MDAGSERLARAGQQTGRQPAVGRRWMIATPNAWASLVGARLLDEGVGAVDAAIAVSAALMVAVPHQCSPGGDAFWLLRPPGSAALALDASGRSGALADPEELRSRGHARVPPRAGPAVTVPGLVDGWHTVAARFGTRSPESLVAPAVGLAREGLPATPYLVRQWRVADALLARRAETSHVFRPHGRAVGVGELVRLPDLADSLEIAASDPASYRDGPMAERISRAVREDGGWLSVADLASHASEWRDPLMRDVPASVGPAGWRLVELPPSSQGWLALFTLGLAARLRAGRPRSEDREPLIDAAMVAVVLRGAVLADPEAMGAPAETWLDEAYLDRVAAALPRVASPAPAQVAAALDVPLTLDLPSAGDTVHFAIVDARGFAVSAIQSVYFDFGSGIVPRGTGFSLQNRGAGFSLRRGHPNELGPGKRPLHTLSPALALGSDGELAAVLGCMGGDAQTQVHVQLLDALRRDADPARAAMLPRWFVRPSAAGFEVLAEARRDLPGRLERGGYPVVRVRRFDEVMGHAQVIVRMSDGVMLGGADPRSDGLAFGR